MNKYEQQRIVAFDSIRPHLRQAIGSPISVGDDTNALAFLVSQLAYTEAQTFKRLYVPMQYEQFIPINTEAGEWADSIRYEVMDFVGRGKRISGKGHDIPLVDVSNDQKSNPVYQGAIGYDYTSEELRRSAYLRQPLPQARLMAAEEGYRRHLNNVGLYGEKDLTGLFNNPLVPRGNATAGNWANGTTTVAQILSDFNAGLNLVWTNTAYNDLPDTVLLPPLVYSYLASTPRSANTDTTILTYLKQNNIAFNSKNIQLNIQPGYGLDTAGQGGVTRAVFYKKDPSRLAMYVPLPLRFLAPQPLNLAVRVPGEYKYSGVFWRYPKSAYYMDNV
jgi:hypothetical protein